MYRFFLSYISVSESFVLGQTNNTSLSPIWKLNPGSNALQSQLHFNFFKMNVRTFSYVDTHPNFNEMV